MQDLLTKIREVLTSKRFVAFYWHTGAMAFAGFLDLVLQELTLWDANNLITVLAGLVFAQITKELNNRFSQTQ